MAREKATVNHEDDPFPAESNPQQTRPISTETTATATIAATRPTSPPAGSDGDGQNTLTIIGQGTPSSFELTVDGEIELADEDRVEDVTVLSGTTVEGTIETGMITFRFTGDLTNVTFVDRGITGDEPATTPNVHVDYAEPERA
ncbi:hypothetical protein [Natrinema caseinilyticum]|uniref:hypothetical protein n=1 Tax=Natrinema caseinilyticum TaxID=2961570 RepID=UPI0020C4A82B|nr:hypothetical protein [Natrinema caseinilyticum]